MKNSVVENIQKAKKSHLSQLHYIQLLVRGITLDEKTIYKSQYDCIFGQWIFGDGEKLKEYFKDSLIDEVQKMHALWHEEYLKIYQIFFTKKAGIFTRFMGRELEISAMERDKAKLYLNELESTTEKLVEKLDVVVRKVGALGITAL